MHACLPMRRSGRRGQKGATARGFHTFERSAVGPQQIQIENQRGESATPARLPARPAQGRGWRGGDGAQRGGCTQPAGARGSPAGGAYRPCVQKGRDGMSAAAALRRGCRGCCELLSSLLAGRLLTCSQQQAQRCRWGCPWLPSPRCQRPQTRPRRLQSGAAPPPRRLQAPAGRAW